MAAQREDCAVSATGNFKFALDLARVGRRYQMFTAALDPAHGARQTARGVRDEEILRIEFAAHTEAAADVRLDHLDGRLR